MEYTRLGSSGLKISRIGLGTMSFGSGSSGREGWPIPYDDAASRPQQVTDNAAAVGKVLSKETLAGIDTALGDAVERDGSLVGSTSPKETAHLMRWGDATPRPQHR